MERKICTLPRKSGNKWLRFGAAVMLAVLLTATVLFIPVISSSSPGFSTGNTFNLPSAFDATLVRAANGITITKSATPVDFVDQGSFITYTLTITNNTGTSLTTLVVNDTVPANTSCDQIFDGSDSSGGEWLARRRTPSLL